MVIFLTKNLSDAISEELIEPEQKADPQSSPAAAESLEDNPLFSWTANWANIWDYRRTYNTLVLVNNATRFVVAIYQVKRQDLKSKNVKDMIQTAIERTLLEMNWNYDLVMKYLQLAGELKFTKNRNRKAAAWVAHAGYECGFYTVRKYNRGEKVYDDKVGVPANFTVVRSSDARMGEIVPAEAMKERLSQLTGLPLYKYKAYELEISLDLEVYKAVRRVIVPANLRLKDLHKLIQGLFNWKGYHLHDFAVYKENQFVSGRGRPDLRLVPYEGDLEWDDQAVLIADHSLSEFLPEYHTMVYTYDFGDYWQHEIKLIRIIDDYDEDSPFLLEAKGQAPPEDVGGVGGFVEFWEAMLDESHPDHEENKAWAGYWKPELSDWQKGPRHINLFWS